MAPSVCINHFNDVGADEDHDHDEEDVRLLDDKIGAVWDFSMHMVRYSRRMCDVMSTIL